MRLHENVVSLRKHVRLIKRNYYDDEENNIIKPDNIKDKDIQWIYNNSKYLKASIKEKEIIFNSDVAGKLPNSRRV